MNRRQFLSFASVPIAASVVMPELLRTIILPPRGGWPDLSRYLTSKDTWYLKGDFDTANLRYVKRERYSGQFLTGADIRRHIGKDLEKFWREAYDKGVLCDDGKRYRLAEDWTAFYGSST